MIYFILWLALSFFVGMLGANKSIGSGGAFVVSLIFSPLIGLIVVIISSPKKLTPEETLPHKAIIIEAEKAEFKGDTAKAIDLYLDALYHVKKYNFKTSHYKEEQASKISELENKITSLGGSVPKSTPAL